MTFFTAAWAWLTGALPTIQKYWQTIAVLIVAALLAWFWFDGNQSAYQRGHNDATAKISLEIAENTRKQTESALKQERSQAADFAEKQAKLEKEKQYAETTINNLRRELNRVQQYAYNQGRRQRLPAADKASGASDEAFAKGWELFGKCTHEYAGMAEIADKQRNDLAEWQAYGEVIKSHNLKKSE